MKTRELEFLYDLFRSTDGDNIYIVANQYEGDVYTLASQFGICGKHAKYPVEAGFYVFEAADWQMFGDYEPSAIYEIEDAESRVFYFSPVVAVKSRCRFDEIYTLRTSQVQFSVTENDFYDYTYSGKPITARNNVVIWSSETPSLSFQPDGIFSSACSVVRGYFYFLA